MNFIDLLTASYYDYPSNFSNGSLVDGIGDLFSYVHYATGNVLGGMVLLSIAIIMFITLKASGYPASKALSATSFVATMVATTLMMMGVLSFTIVMLCAIITLVMALVARDEAIKGL